MSDIIPILCRHPLVGAWRNPDPDYASEFTVSAAPDGFTVMGVDINDGEQHEIWGVSWDGMALRFTSRMPSTNHVVEHEFRLNGVDHVIHRFTLLESWIRASKSAKNHSA